VAVLTSRSITVREALGLFGLFISQFILGAVLPAEIRHWERVSVAIVDMVLATGMFIVQRRAIAPLARDGFLTPVEDMVGDEEPAR
jgi:cation:H+ antiporter